MNFEANFSIQKLKPNNSAKNNSAFLFSVIKLKVSDFWKKIHRFEILKMNFNLLIINFLERKIAFNPHGFLIL
jgi:hypothetical protein